MSATTSMASVTLRVEVPICAFRPHESREYQDTHPFPPPSAVYGMLLSFCGVPREAKSQHQGIRMALALESKPDRAKVFRKFRRGKELGELRPDYQDLLFGLKLWVWLEVGADRGQPTLIERITSALDHPHEIHRSGGLSLGESSYLVDTIRVQEPDAARQMQFLMPDLAGFYSLPVWVDHEHNHNRRQRFIIVATSVAEGLNRCWVDIFGTSAEQPGQA